MMSRVALSAVLLATTLWCQSEAPAAGAGQVVPSAAAKGALTLLTYANPKPVVLSLGDLKAMPHISVTTHNPHANADETFSGVRFADLLAKIGAPLGSALHGKALADYIVATGSDGYRAVLALGEGDPSFQSGGVIVADSMEGKPFDAHLGCSETAGFGRQATGPLGEKSGEYRAENGAVNGGSYTPNFLTSSL